MTQPPDDAALVASLKANADPRCHQHVPSLSLEAATALEAKDRRIAEMREAGERLLLAMTTRALRGRDHVPSMRDEQDAARAFRAALEPSDKGVGSA